MQRAYACTLGLVAVLLSAAPAHAFQEVPAAPSNEAMQVLPEPQPPAMELQKDVPAAGHHREQGGSKLFNFSLLPKLDFGLELLYSQQPTEVPQDAIPDANDDLSVLGKVKRHF